MRVAGNWSNSGTFSGSVERDADADDRRRHHLSNGSLFGGLTIRLGRHVHPAGPPVGAGGTVTLTSGTLNAGSFTARIGAFAQTSGSFVPATGTLILDSPSSQTVAARELGRPGIDTGKEANLVGYWKLDGGAGAGIFDRQGTETSGHYRRGGTWPSSVPAEITFTTRIRDLQRRLERPQRSARPTSRRQRRAVGQLLGQPDR